MAVSGRPGARRSPLTTRQRVLSRLMALLDARAARAAHELGVEQVDLMSVLLSRRRGPDYDFFHATPAGAREIATAIAAAVLRQPRRDPATSRSSLGAMAAIDGHDEELRVKAS